MKTLREGQRNWSAIMAVTTLFALAIAAPFIAVEWGPDATLRSSSFRGAAVLAATRDSFTISQPLRLVENPRLTIVRGTISFVQASGEKMPTGQAMLAVLTGGSAGLALDGATLTLGDAPTDIGAGASDDVPVAPIVDALASHSYKTLTLTRCRLIVYQRGTEPLVLDDLEATVTTKRSTRSAFGSFRLRGEVVAFETSVGLDGDGTNPTRLPLTASIKSEFIKSDIAGHLALDTTLQVTARRASVRLPSVRKAAQWLGADWPDGAGLAGFAIDGELDWSSRALAFTNATISIDGNKANGMLALKTSGPRPAIDGTLAFDRLDLTPYLRQPAPEERAPAFSLARLLSWDDWTEPTPISLAEHVDADLRLSANVIVVDHEQLGRSAATVSLKASKLLADVAELDLGGGARGSGQVSIDFAPPSPVIGLKAKFERVELASVLQRAVGHPVLRGRSEIGLDLTTFGANAAEIAGGASGRISLNVPDGGQIGADIRALAATSLSGQLDGWGAAGRGQTPIDSLVAELTIADGVVATQSTTARAGGTLLQMGGALGLADRSMDLKLAISNPGEPAAQSPGTPQLETAATNASLLHMQGQWDKPKIQRLPFGERAALERWIAAPMLLGSQQR